MDERQEQDNDQEFLRAFNLGYELQRFLGNDINKGFDQAMARQLGRTLDKSQSNSEKLEAVKQGQKQFIRDKELEKRRAEKSNVKKQDKERER